MGIEVRVIGCLEVAATSAYKGQDSGLGAWDLAVASRPDSYMVLNLSGSWFPLAV